MTVINLLFLFQLALFFVLLLFNQFNLSGLLLELLFQCYHPLDISIGLCFHLNVCNEEKT